MKIIIDERETHLYEKCKEIANTHFSQTPYLTIEKTVLHIGDTYITTDEGRHVCVIERKTIADLLASIKDGRYEEQSQRLLHSTHIHPHNIIYIIEGMMSQCKTFMEKKLVYSCITSLNHFKGMTVFRTSGIQETAELIIWYSDKIERNFLKHILPKYLSNIYGHPNAEPVEPVEPTTNNNVVVVSNETNETNETTLMNNNTVIATDDDTNTNTNTTHNTNEIPLLIHMKKSKKENITPENIGTKILSQIPYVNTVIANAIMKQYDHSLKKLMADLETNPNCLNELYIENQTDGKKRKIASNAIKNIHTFLLPPIIQQL